VKPRLSRKARVRADPRDGRPVLLSPERGLRLSDTAAAVIAMCDGTHDVDAIVGDLARRYDTGRARVDRDVRELLSSLHARALLDGFETSSGDVVGMPLESDREAVLSDGDAHAPYTLVAELTHRCPLACPYCSNPKPLVGGAGELRTDEWLRVVDEARELGVMQVHLTGGEPLARSDLEAIALHCRGRDLYVNLVTSGVPLHRERLERLAPSLDHVQLSIQDADRASSDAIAGIAAFDSKMGVARWVKELGIPLTLNVVLHRANLDRVGEVVALAESLGADRLELANVQMVSWALDNAEALLPSRAQIDRARAVAQVAKQRLRGRMEVVFVLPDWHAERPRACMDGWARRFVVVAPDGLVLPCHAARALPLPFESVRDAPLARIWEHGDAMRAYRGEAWMPDPCKACDRRGVDFGGCRCQAHALTGDARLTDPACALSPHHGLVRAAVERAETVRTPSRWLYRGR